MSQRFAVVYEANADYQLATEIADRELVDAIDWLEHDQLDSQRSWMAELEPGMQFTWMSIKKLASDAGVKAHGHFDGKPKEADATAARRAIRYLLRAIPDLKAILLIRDQDDKPDRRIGLEQARAEDRSGLPIVIGLAIVERECWVISGFDPRDDAETTRLEDERQRLGFDPRSQSHDLTACKDNAAIHSSKRVLRSLSQDDLDRECLCWRETPLATLRARGVQNGLTAFLDEVRSRLAPLIGHVAK
jgi:hypothetical protein